MGRLARIQLIFFSFFLSVGDILAEFQTVAILMFTTRVVMYFQLPFLSFDHLGSKEINTFCTFAIFSAPLIIRCTALCWISFFLFFFRRFQFHWACSIFDVFPSIIRFCRQILLHQGYSLWYNDIYWASSWASLLKHTLMISTCCL